MLTWWLPGCNVFICLKYALTSLISGEICSGISISGDGVGLGGSASGVNLITDRARSSSLGAKSMGDTALSVVFFCRSSFVVVSRSIPVISNTRSVTPWVPEVRLL